MNIYLYIKTHNLTGLKYLGKTVQNPYSYPGSGKYWKQHIKEYGNDVSTKILKECKNKDELSYWGRYYSEIYDVVNSDSWANKIPETGGGPGRSGFNKGKNNPMYGKVRIDLKGANSPNKREDRRDKSREIMNERWNNLEYREYIKDYRRKLWQNPEYLKKMKGRTKTNKRIMINQIEYNSLKEAAIILGLHPSTISKRCSSAHERFACWNYI